MTQIFIMTTLDELIEELRTEAGALGIVEEDAVKAHIQTTLREHRQKEREFRQQQKLKEAELKHAKELREAELQVEKELKEAQLRQEKEIKEAELQLEKDKLQVEKELKESEMQLQSKQMHEIESRKIELMDAELQLKKASAFREEERKKESLSLKSRPKPPYFDEKHDDFESYLFRFEQHAMAVGWKESEKASMLADCLKGRALQFYFELMSIDPTTDYDKVKTHLLKRFQCTEEGFREKFRSSRPEVTDTFPAYFDRMRRYFFRWIDLAGVEKNFDKLVDLVLKEQMFSACSLNLVTFLKESEVTACEDLVRLAERYREAHRTESLARTVAEGVCANVADVQSSSQGRGGPRGRGYTFYRRPGRGHNQVQGGGSSPLQQGQPSGRGGATPSHTPSTPRSGKGGKLKCYWCESTGHSMLDCPEKRKYLKGVVENAGIGLVPTATMGPEIQTCTGTVNGLDAIIMLDSGCTTVGVRRSLVRPEQFLNKTISCRLFDGQIVQLPLANIHLDCDHFTGYVDACIIDQPVCDVVLGKVPGSRVEVAGAAVTRAQAKKLDRPFRPLLTSKVPQLDVTPDTLATMQRQDPGLKTTFDKVGQPRSSQGDLFVIRDGLLFRSLTQKDGSTLWQLVVPAQLVESVLIAAHDSLFGGHLASNSTFKRVYPFFYWSGYRAQIRDYCRSCDICQRTFPKGRVPAAPLQEVPLIDTPFSRVAVDIIGPLTPKSDRGHRFVLTYVDVATRYPEAVALKTITTEAVAEALVEIFSRTGIPDEMLSDQGSQFTSDVMREVMRLLSVSQLHSTPYHPQTNGLVERFNGTLKSMLKKLMDRRPKDWDRYLPGALFAYREIPQESTKFSPFELLYGRVPKGPTQLLFDCWTGESHSDPKLVSEYVQNLKESMTEMVQLAQDAVQSASRRNHHYKLQRGGVRTFKVGSKVLVLLPSVHNKMLLRCGRVRLTSSRRRATTTTWWRWRVLRRCFTRTCCASSCRGRLCFQKQ